MPKLDGTGAPVDSHTYYYIQDTRQIVGNCALWWRHEGKGYTCELLDAGLFKGNSSEVHSDRDCDVPWPAELVRKLVIGHVTTDHLYSHRKSK